MREKKPYISHESLSKFAFPIDYVKYIFDTEYTISREGDKLPGCELITREYKNSDNENQKELIAKAVIELLDDPDYSCDAIPVVADLGLEEAKEWFLNLSKKPLDEIRNIKTSNFIDAFNCLLNYTKKNNIPFVSILKEKIYTEHFPSPSYRCTLDCISMHDPAWINKDLLTHINHSFDEKIEERLSYSFRCYFGRLFESIGYKNIVDVSRRLIGVKYSAKDSVIRFIESYVLNNENYKKYAEEALRILK